MVLRQELVRHEALVKWWVKNETQGHEVKRELKKEQGKIISKPRHTNISYHFKLF